MFDSHKEIVLDEVTHKYTLVNEPDFEFTSCTTFISLFFPPFDKIGVANKLTSTNSNYFKMSPQDLVNSWNESTKEGTDVHHQIDEFLKHKTIPQNDKANIAVRWLINSSFLGEKIFSEIMIYSKEIKIAGTVDLLVYDPSNDSYNIYDWKTSKKIERTAFKNRRGITHATEAIHDCNFYHYSLQLSLYRYILENFYDVKISKTTLLHINSSDVISYECEYLKSTIEEMLLENISLLKVNYEEGITKEFLNY